MQGFFRNQNLSLNRRIMHTCLNFREKTKEFLSGCLRPRKAVSKHAPLPPYYYLYFLLELQAESNSYFSLLSPELIWYLCDFVNFRVTIGQDDGWFTWADASSPPGLWNVTFRLSASGVISGSVDKQSSLQVVLSKSFYGRWLNTESFDMKVVYEDGSVSLFKTIYDEIGGMAKVSVEVQSVGDKKDQTLWQPGTHGSGGGSLQITWA